MFPHTPGTGQGALRRSATQYAGFEERLFYVMQYTNKDTFIVSVPGCLDTEPDSLEAIIAGNDAGANGCAINLDMTADGIAVLCGSGSFPAANDTRIELSESTFEEARAAFQKIVAIGQAIELAKSCGSKLCIHMKNLDLCAQTQLALSHADYIDLSYFVGVSLQDAARLAARFRALHFMANVLETPSDEGALIHSAQENGLFGLRVAPAVLTQSLCDEAHRVGLFVSSTECHDEAMLQRLIDMGVNFIETLRPDIAFDLLPPVEEDTVQISL